MFLGQCWGAELESEVLLTPKSIETIVLGCTEISWRSGRQAMSSTGVLQTGMDARLEELHFEPHNCKKDLVDGRG